MKLPAAPCRRPSWLSPFVLARPRQPETRGSAVTWAPRDAVGARAERRHAVADARGLSGASAPPRA
eukprot:7377365-Prymnesium_polylepis.1